MQNEKHPLPHEFPEHAIDIAKLKSDDPAFAALAKEYHQLDHHIYGLEASNIPTTDANFIELKTRRLVLKDQIYQKLIQGDF
ncbi:DUF465 domain-containing protein [Moritella marina ATCC 15381]|uniref:DUF465 domain-containing protein n=1 Tax=Moritella marina ATCC 15381 TaxID=1202962 RepID=A0A5J6WMT4_MORMI|nr:DUF465 domain-containing protein [Moritella marina]QFI39433.1 DUF465 domain-containing protein [Moritella marina ATCC 15381]